MQQGLDTVGDVVHGALVAAAIEPGASATSADGHTHESACLNCGTRLLGVHCHACGQHAHVHRTLAAFFHDLLHGVFHVEGRIWRTLPLLVWRPGTLTREYIDGRRASYVSPMATFLFCAFLLFATIHALEPEFEAPSERTVAAAIAAKRQEIARLDQARAKVPAKDLDADDLPDVRGGIDRKQAATRAELATLVRLQQAGVTEAPAEFDDHAAYSSIGWLDRIIHKARHNPELVIYKLQNSAYKYAWALVPISVPLVWLLFPFSRRFKMYDHTVFVTYSLSFMMLLTIVLSGADWIGTPGVPIAAMLVPPWHVYRQTRGTYGLSRKSALWRTAALMVIAALALAVFTLALLAIGLL